MEILFSKDSIHLCLRGAGSLNLRLMVRFVTYILVLSGKHTVFSISSRKIIKTSKNNKKIFTACDKIGQRVETL